MINKSELPKNWEIKKLGELCQFEYGKGLTKKDRDENGIYNVYGSNGVVGKHNEYLIDEPCIIVGRKGAAGEVHLSLNPCWAIDTTYFVKKPEYFDLKFLYYLLKALNLQSLDKSTAIPGLNRNDAYDKDVPLPPLAEQERIVAKIEELFSELDAGRESLKTAAQQLKTYRQAVLNSLIDSGEKKTIESVIENLDQGWSPKCLNEQSTNNDEWAVIKTTAIQAGYFQDFENKRLPDSLEPRTQHELKKGDLLITRAGPRVRVGVCCLVRNTRPKLINCDKVYRMRVRSNIAIPEYIELVLNSPTYSREIEKMKTGINDSGVNLTQKGFVQISIPVPTLEEQQRIVEEIESRLSVCDKLEETISQSLAQAESLRQSILKQAFAGKLVSTQYNYAP